MGRRKELFYKVSIAKEEQKYDVGFGEEGEGKSEREEGKKVLFLLERE